MKKARAMYIPAGGKKAVWGPVDQNVLPEGYPYKEGVSIKWDGNTEGLFRFSDKYYKVSNATPDNETLKNTVITWCHEGGYSEHDLSQFWDEYVAAGYVNEDYTLLAGFAVVIRVDNLVVNDSPPLQAGVYFTKDAYGYVAGLLSETIHTMAPEFLPAGVGGGAFIVNVTMDEEENFVADKTYVEISEALASGKIPYCIFNTAVFQLMSSDALSDISLMVEDIKKHLFVNISHNLMVTTLAVQENDRTAYEERGFISTN